MRFQDKQELKAKPEGELRKVLNEEREKLRTLKFDLASGKVKNVSEIWKTKKNIARVLTFLRMKATAK